MTREEAIRHIWGLSSQVAQEYCVGMDEHEALEKETLEALAALGVSPEESDR